MEELSEVFKTWKHIKFVCCENSTRYDPIELDCAVIEEALTELKKINESNPSEALECLEDLRKECISTYFDENKKQIWTTDKNKDYRCNTIKPALLKAQALEAELEEFLGFKDGRTISSVNYKGKQIVAMPLEEYDKLVGKNRSE